MSRLMALDVGEARIGVAVSDSTGLLASPYTTLYVSRDEAQVWAAIQQVINEVEAEKLVVGLPISLDGQIHKQGEWVLAFAERLKEHISIPMAFWDERLSTVEAQRLMAERSANGQGKRTQFGGQQSKRGRKGRRRKSHEIDALAATVILQEYLDSLGNSTKET